MEKLNIQNMIPKKNSGDGNQKTPLAVMEFERKRVELLNRMPGNLDGYDCKACLNRGYFSGVDDAGYRTIRTCSCMIIRNGRKRLERSGLADMAQRYSFEAWKTPEKWQEKAKKSAENFCDCPEGHWFFAAGQVGAGKSHLCTAVTVSLMEHGLDARYMLWRDTAVQAKACVNDDVSYGAIVGPLKSVKVLYIDDFFKGAVTNGDINLAFEILNSRYNDSEKITILSSEKTIAQIMGVDEAIGSRIYERSKGYYLELSGVKNWRLQ